MFTESVLITESSRIKLSKWKSLCLLHVWHLHLEIFVFFFIFKSCMLEMSTLCSRSSRNTSWESLEQLTRTFVCSNAAFLENLKENSVILQLVSRECSDISVWKKETSISRLPYTSSKLTWNNTIHSQACTMTNTLQSTINPPEGSESVSFWMMSWGFLVTQQMVLPIMHLVDYTHSGLCNQPHLSQRLPQCLCSSSS